MINPQIITIAEHFNYDKRVTEPADKDPNNPSSYDQLGFDLTWYNEAHQQLVNKDTAFKPGLVQAAANKWYTDMDRLMNYWSNPPDISGHDKALAPLTHHDIVGNDSGRVIEVADLHRFETLPSRWRRGLARFASCMSFFGPGVPMVMQGDESGAKNAGSWGKPSTWDIGWEWNNEKIPAVLDELMVKPKASRLKDPRFKTLSDVDKKMLERFDSLHGKEKQAAAYEISRRQLARMFPDMAKLRMSSPALQAAARPERVYTHNDDSIIAAVRRSGDEAYLIVGSVNSRTQYNYPIDLPEGKWQEVFNSNAEKYGGNNEGNGGHTFSGHARITIPKEGVLVFKLVK